MIEALASRRELVVAISPTSDCVCAAFDTATVTLRAEDEADKWPLVAKAEQKAGLHAFGEHAPGAPASRIPDKPLLAQPHSAFSRHMYGNTCDRRSWHT